MVNFKVTPYKLNELELLSHREAIQLLKEYKAGNKEALERLVKSQLRLAYQLIDRIANEDMKDDLISEVNTAILYAINKWDPERGRLSTITTIAVRQAISKFIQNNKYGIKIPYNVMQEYKRASKAQKRTEKQDRIIENLSRIFNMEYLSEVSKNNPTLCYNENKNELNENEERIEKLRLCKKIIEGLPVFEKDLLLKYFGFTEKKYRLKDLSDEYNMSIAKVRTVIERACEKVKDEFIRIWN